MHTEDGLNAFIVFFLNMLICCVVWASMYTVPVDMKQLVGLKDRVKFKSPDDL